MIFRPMSDPKISSDRDGTLPKPKTGRLITTPRLSLVGQMPTALKLSTIWIWRKAYQDDFATQVDFLVNDYRFCSHFNAIKPA